MGFLGITILALWATKVSAEYLNIASEPIDSSEHGGAPGPKGTTCPCGWANKGQSRIVNGVETNFHEFPFIVALIDPVREIHLCGGTIITAQHVLTAGHCTEQYVKTGDRLIVVVGDHDLHQFQDHPAEKGYDVRRIIEHPQYDTVTLKRDISLLLLSKAIEFNKFVGRVCMSPVKLVTPRDYVKLIGWGHLRENGTGSPTLQEVNVRVVDIHDCNRKHGNNVSYTNPTQICTYGHNKGPCNGDSGGPVLYREPQTNRYFLAGIISYAQYCGDDYPTVHTDVSVYYSWIQDTIRESVPRKMCDKKN